MAEEKPKEKPTGKAVKEEKPTEAPQCARVSQTMTNAFAMQSFLY